MHFRFHRWLVLTAAFVLSGGCGGAELRDWSRLGMAAPFGASYAGCDGKLVVLTDGQGRKAEIALEKLSPETQFRIFEMEAGNGRPFSFPKQTSLVTRAGYKARSVESLAAGETDLDGAGELHVTGGSLPPGSVNFTSPDAWLVFDRVPASKVIAGYLDRVKVYGVPAKLGENIRVTQHGSGSVIIPHGRNFPAMTVFLEKNAAGPSMPLRCHDRGESVADVPVASFRLKRGYMVTLAKNPDGTGVSRNYVAQDHDLEVGSLPAGLEGGIGFIRIFPWRWTPKKGVAGGIAAGLNVGWFYDWNISTNSTPDLEYVPIKQKRWWPGLDQDWKARGSLHLLGFNEPDRPDQAKMTVDEAIQGWPELQRTGLRLGSPATSDGGLGWLYEFMDKADKGGLRVDFVAVHYYRATADPGDAKGAARQLHDFLKGIHDRVKRPLWVTEWNNGANWTTAPDPDERQQRDAIREMVKMLDEAPFVERYAIYNWVEDARQVKKDDGSLTPAGEVYRDQESPQAYLQEKQGR